MKLIWTVDAEQAIRFSREYSPHCDILLTQVNWNGWGRLIFFPRSAQMEILHQIGRQTYFKLPKAGTNPRGVEISAEALDLLTDHSQSLNIPVRWYQEQVDYNPYERWLELWKKD